MTTVATPPPAVGGPALSPVGEPVTMVRVVANLLPDSVVAARRLSKLKRQLGYGFVGLLGFLVIAYGWSWVQTHSSRDDLSSAQHHSNTLRQQMRAFTPLLTAQTRQQAITSQLRSVMATDLQWRDLIGRVKAKAGSGVQVTDISGSVAAGSASAVGGGGLSVLNHTGWKAIGSLTVTGTAPDNRAVAAFVDGLSKTKGLASPIPVSVSGTKGAVTFTINLLITTDALGGRFASSAATPAAASAGGK